MNRPLAGLAVLATTVAALLAMQTETFSWIDAVGPKLRMAIAGNGSPTIVFDTGGGGSLELWGRVPSEVSRFAKTVSYDRAGNGMSDKPTTLRDARNIATELHSALRNANVAPPYILVGHSVGGLYMRVFAGMYPNEVAGLVLVDPTQEETQAWAKEHGLALPGLGECTFDERSCYDDTLAQARESSVPPDVPVFLIHVMYPWARHPFPSRDLEEMERTQKERVAVRLKFHKEWVNQVSGAKLIITENSSHGGINFEEPELVVRTIIEAIEVARAKTGQK
jgi:pimeloyl-ACP methyl ester carboxylesterase